MRGCDSRVSLLGASSLASPLDNSAWKFVPSDSKRHVRFSESLNLVTENEHKRYCISIAGSISSYSIPRHRYNRIIEFVEKMSCVKFGEKYSPCEQDRFLLQEGKLRYAAGINWRWLDGFLSLLLVYDPSVSI